VLLLPAWVCMSIRLPMFSGYGTSVSSAASIGVAVVNGKLAM